MPEIRPESVGRRRPATAMDGAIALIAILLIIQMWVLTASLESYLAGHIGVAFPAALVSGAIFSVCCLLYLFVSRLDREARGD
jgi:hypothetical protein